MDIPQSQTKICGITHTYVREGKPAGGDEMLTGQERAERERKEKEYMRRLAKRTDALNKASIVLSAIALVISAAAILLKLC